MTKTPISCYVLSALLFINLSCGKNNKDEPAPPSTPIAEGTTVKIMTYNIHIGNPPSKPEGTVELEAAANVIKAQNPDLVALQEVDNKTNRSGSAIDQAKELGRLTGMNYYFGKALNRDGGEYGVAVLSKLPIIATSRYELPVTTALGGEKRVLALITVEKEGQRFLFASTHLDHLTAEDNRILQADELNKVIKTFTLPLIVAGDFNATPNSITISRLRQELTLGCKGNCPFTFRATRPTSTIDYVFIRPAHKLYVLNYATVNELYASDHLPLVTEIQIVK